MRRTLAILLLAGLVVAPGQAAAAASACDPPGYQTFGPASVTGAIVGAAVHDGHAYVVTQGLKPPIVADIDLTTRTVVRQSPIPDGPATGEPEGAWATTVSGGQLYIGAYPVPDLYRMDLTTGVVTRLFSLGVNGGFIWSLTTAPDGKVYAGTYPDGKVWEYDPATGAAPRNFGVLATGERYVRAVAADAATVYAGLLDKHKLVAIDRATGVSRVLADAGTGFGAVAVAGDRVLGASGTVLVDVRTDGSDLKTTDLAALGLDSIDSIAMDGDGSAVVSTRPNGVIYRYRAGALTPMGTPRLGEETRLLVPSPGTLTGFSGSGGFWTMDPATGTTEFTDLIAAGLTPGSERPQSILLQPNKYLYVGGHFSITVRDLQTGSTRRVWVPGEPKALARRGNELFAAIYPSGQIIALDPRDDSIRSLGYLGNGQKRPWDLEYDPVTDKLLVASAPLGADLQGALSIVDPDTGEKQVYKNVIPDESLYSLTVDSAAGIVYLGGDVLGGGGTPATKTAASVAAFDLNTRRVLWQVDPVAGYKTLQDIKVYHGVLYGVYKRTTSWFAMDLATRTLLGSGPLTTYGEIEVHRGRVFASSFNAQGAGEVHLLGTTSATKLASGLGMEWYTNPQLAFEPGSWDAWTLVGRDLARVRLDPGCPALIL
ncbi:MAG: PQQ-like beta-propeller repeat protein [Hamadaea sp.]|nr:PQQ-like beta-propeller repeat protein [Hamadaea sp.]